MLITLTKTGFIKRVPLEVYKAQKRGGKGKSAMTVYDDDIITELMITNTHASLLFFSSLLTSFPFHVTAAAAAAETLTFSSLEG